MRLVLTCAFAILLAEACTFAGPTDDVYHLGPDSEPHAGVPQGKVIGPTVLASNVYPNTTRDYWVYVPAQYDPAKPACLMIFFDGHAYVGLTGRLPHSLRLRQPDLPARDAGHDRRLHQPRPHARPEGSHRTPTGATARTNRRVEYNALDDKYSKLDRRRAAAGLEQAVQHLRRTRRPRDLRRQLGSDLRVHRGLAPARPVPQGHQHHRQLHQHHGRPRLSRPDPPERAQADPHLPPGRRERQPRPRAETAATTRPGTGTLRTSRWSRR